MTSMIASLPENYTFDMPHCKRKREFTYTEVDDETKPDIFSIECKKMLSTKISRCLCGGLRICMPCVIEHNPTLLDCDDVCDDTCEEYEVDDLGCFEKLPDLGAPKCGLKLCKRSDTTCDDGWSGLSVLPCTVCKRYDNNHPDVFRYEYEDCKMDLFCDHDICPHCLASEPGYKCQVCDTDCTV